MLLLQHRLLEMPHQACHLVKARCTLSRLVILLPALRIDLAYLCRPSIWNECGCKKSVLIQDVDSVEVVVV